MGYLIVEIPYTSEEDYCRFLTELEEEFESRRSSRNTMEHIEVNVTPFIAKNEGCVLERYMGALMARINEPFASRTFNRELVEYAAAAIHAALCSTWPDYCHHVCFNSQSRPQTFFEALR